MLKCFVSVASVASVLRLAPHEPRFIVPLSHPEHSALAWGQACSFLFAECYWAHDTEFVLAYIYTAIFFEFLFVL